MCALEAVQELLAVSNLEYGPGLTADVEVFIRDCVTCQKLRFGPVPSAAALHTIEIHEPFEMLHVDTMGPFPPDDDGKKYILVFTDGFSRFMELIPTARKSAEEVADALLQVSCRYGPPRLIRSDQGGEFVNHLVTTLEKAMGTTAQTTLAYRPQANGIVERANQEVKRHLQPLVQAIRGHRQWSRLLPMVQRIVNSQPHASTGVAPLTLVYGDMCTRDRGVLQPFPNGQGPVTVSGYVERLLAVQKELTDASRAHQQAVIEKRLEMSPENPAEFLPGDYVLVSYPSRPPSKLHAKWRGPMLVKQRLTDTHYLVQDIVTGSVSEMHLSRFKLCRIPEGYDALDIAAADAGEDVVEAIVDHLIDNADHRTWQFRVRWAGYDASEDTWHRFEDIKSCAALDEYLKENPELPRKFRKLRP